MDSKKDTFEQYYTQLYSEETFPKNDRLRITRFQKISSLIKRNSCVLDYGGGDGFLEKFLDTSIKYCIIDLAETHKQSLRNGNKILKFSGDGKISVEDEFFDVVVMSEVIEHIPNVYDVLIEIKRILKKDGKLILTTPNAYNVYYIFRSCLGKHLDPSGEHLYLFDWSHLTNLLNFAGFSVVDVNTFFFLPGKFYSSYLLLFDKVSTRLLKYLNLQLFVVCKKRN